jgi:hypothetical protein
MSGFNLDDYKTVPERIEELKAQFPLAVLRSRIVDLPAAFADRYLAVEAECWLTPDHPRPALGLAWEPVPGKTPYTEDSELQNAETSAWGRAIVAALAADTSKGIASREDIQQRQGAPSENWAEWVLAKIEDLGDVNEDAAKRYAHDAMQACEYAHPLSEDQAKKVLGTAIDLIGMAT